ncbi:hypothetical protein [Nocardioides panaciterrulae]|uniref:Uncharacterized protein n=1 Tax=Nocardioides panaciterrulae TaxID=661492 RepID=A0A7Y9E9R0_9ACTN|nr:hypothetical protein [Nocardioides panaciterrulae]NYD43819.1 hypothetical protein [Nocardioides panaciterrulae]
MSAPVPSPGLAPADRAVATAVRSLDLALDLTLDDPPEDRDRLEGWRRLVRQRLADLRAALAAEAVPTEDAWLVARGGVLARERDALGRRTAALGSAVLDSPDTGAVRADLRRLLADVAHHVQRRHDLAYDAVELELGGED